MTCYSDSACPSRQERYPHAILSEPWHGPVTGWVSWRNRPGPKAVTEYTGTDHPKTLRTWFILVYLLRIGVSTYMFIVHCVVLWFEHIGGFDLPSVLTYCFHWLQAFQNRLSMSWCIFGWQNLNQNHHDLSCFDKIHFAKGSGVSSKLLPISWRANKTIPAAPSAWVLWENQLLIIFLVGVCLAFVGLQFRKVPENEEDCWHIEFRFLGPQKSAGKEPPVFFGWSLTPRLGGLMY